MIASTSNSDSGSFLTEFSSSFSDLIFWLSEMLVSASISEGLLLGEPGADAYKSCKIRIRNLIFINQKRIILKQYVVQLNLVKVNGWICSAIYKFALTKKFTLTKFGCNSNRINKQTCYLCLIGQTICEQRIYQQYQIVLNIRLKSFRVSQLDTGNYDRLQTRMTQMILR